MGFGSFQVRGKGFPGGSDGKESACNVGDPGWGLLVLFGNGRENWVLQEKWEVWVHPERKFRNGE